MGLNSLIFLTNFAHLTALTSKCSIYDTPCLARLTQNFATSIISNGFGSETELLDPMILPPIKVYQDGFRFEWTNINVLGLKNMFIEKVQFNKQERSMRIKARIPCMKILGNYMSEGYIQNVPYFGKGKVEINQYDFENDMTFNYDIVKGKNGKEYLYVTKYSYWFDVHHMDSFYENMNKDDPIKAFQAQEHMAKEFGSIWQQFGRNVYKEINDKIFETVKKFLLTMSVDDILYDY